MYIYLAAAWSRKEEISKVAEELNKIPGVYVDSRWLEERTFTYSGLPDVIGEREARAQDDLADIRKSDLLVRFADDLSQEMIPSRLASGARLFEMGYAYAIGKPIVVVGGYQAIFDYLSDVIHVKDANELKSWIEENRLWLS